MRTVLKILLIAVLSVLLVSCGKVAETTEETKSNQHVYETPEIALVRIDVDRNEAIKTLTQQVQNLYPEYTLHIVTDIDA